MSKTILESHTIVLDRPLVLGSGDAAVTFHELSLREPTMGELRAARRAGDDLDMLACLIQQVCSIPMAVVDRLPQRVVGEAGAFFGQFSTEQSLAASSSAAQS